MKSKNGLPEQLAAAAAGILAAFLARRLDAAGGLDAFSALSRWLRERSLAGAAGNALAWGAVWLVAALPALGLLLRGRRRADWLLALASAELFAAMYFLANPTLVFPAELAGEGAARGWGLVSFGAALSTLVCWTLLRLLAAAEGEPGRLLPPLTKTAALLYAFFVGLSAASGVLRRVAEVTATNTDATRVTASAAVLWTLAALELIPPVLAAWTLTLGGDLVAALEEAPFAAETVALSERLAARCSTVVRASLVLTAGCNAARLICVPISAVTDVGIYLPLAPMAISASLMALGRYFRRAKAVSDDNDTII